MMKKTLGLLLALLLTLGCFFAAGISVNATENDDPLTADSISDGNFNPESESDR